MTSLPDYYYDCPKCYGTLFAERIVNDSVYYENTWSDGKIVPKRHPELPKIVRCPNCSTTVWLVNKRDEEAIRQEENTIGGWFKKDKVSWLTIDEYFLALENNVFSSDEQERYIRQQIIWAFNDRIRQGKQLINSESESKLGYSNIVRTLELLDYNDEGQILIIAELNRYLGRFEKCKRILSSNNNPKLDFVKRAIEAECDKKSINVVMIGGRRLTQKDL